MTKHAIISELPKYAKDYVVRDYGANSTILYQGEAPRRAGIVLDGVIKVYTISRNGDEQIVTFHIPGEPFPSSWIFDRTPTTLFFYETITPCRIAFINKEDLVSYYHSTPTRTKAMLDYFTANYSASLIRINSLEQPRARDKLLYTLYFLALRYGSANANGKSISVPITLTHQTLANLVGLTRETTAMEMSKLKKERIISYKNQCYTIYIKELLALMGEESFNELSMSSL